MTCDNKGDAGSYVSSKRKKVSSEGQRVTVASVKVERG